MTQVVSVDVKITKDLLFLLRELKEQIARLNEKLETSPPYGSGAWWEWSTSQALKEVKEGKGTVINNKKELKEFFQNLRNA